MTKRETDVAQNDLDVIIETGTILMEGGAEIYRVEETMRHMAAALQMTDFSAYVVNRGIIASGTNRHGIHEAKATSVPETNIHLGKIEAVNALSRNIEQQKEQSSQNVAQRLKEIRTMLDLPFGSVLLAYFFGAGCFSYAIGSPTEDALAAAIAGLVMGLALRWGRRYIRTNVLLTILGSAVVAVSANVFYFCGFGHHRGLIILGALMLLVPGATFVNSVREFAQNNYATGLTLLMSALLTCISIAVGVALATELLPFAEQMTVAFSGSIDSLSVMLVRTAAAGLGTVAFSYLFYASKRYFLTLGTLGAVCWFLYLLLAQQFHSDVLAIFVSGLFVAACSKFFSVWQRCPITIFLSTSIFPLMPGLSFYRAVYFLMTGSDALAYTYTRSCFLSAFAITIAISIVQQIPLRIRMSLRHRG